MQKRDSLRVSKGLPPFVRHQSSYQSVIPVEKGELSLCALDDSTAPSKPVPSPRHTQSYDLMKVQERKQNEDKPIVGLHASGKRESS